MLGKTRSTTPVITSKTPHSTSNTDSTRVDLTVGAVLLGLVIVIENSRRLFVIGSLERMTNDQETAKGRHLTSPFLRPLESIFMRNCLIHLHHHQNRVHASERARRVLILSLPMANFYGAELTCNLEQEDCLTWSPHWHPVTWWRRWWWKTDGRGGRCFLPSFLRSFPACLTLRWLSPWAASISEGEWEHCSVLLFSARMRIINFNLIPVK